MECELLKREAWKSITQTINITIYFDYFHLKYSILFVFCFSFFFYKQNVRILKSWFS